jgi:signal transduction histidine kinase
LRLLTAALAITVVVLGIGAGFTRAAVAAHADDQALRNAQAKLDLLSQMIPHLYDTGTDVDAAMGTGTAFAIDFGARGIVSFGVWTVFLRDGQSLPAPDPGQPGSQVLTWTYRPLASCTGAACDMAGRTLRAVEATVPFDGATVHAYVLVWPFAATEALSTVDPVLWAGLPVGVLLVGLLTWWVVGRVLRPVERMRTELVDITASDLSRRVPVPPTSDELHRWAVTTNETLDRLEAAVGKYRSFVDDAAHELRSPLASLLSTLEVASAHPDRADLPAVVTTALAEARRLQRLTDDLLLLARLDRTTSAHPSHNRVVDLDALVAEQVAERRFAGGGPRYFLSTVEARVVGDEGQLDRVLRNLLDNATRFAEGEVRVTLSRRAGQVDLEVLDDGPGVPAADRARVFDRFTVLDRARDQRSAGTGLGLAIARDIVHRHGGQIAFADSPSGARVVVRLPAASPESDLRQTPARGVAARGGKVSIV